MKYLLILLFSLSLSASSFYQQGLDYLNGKIGAKEITITVKNCPYERCNDGRTGVSTQKVKLINNGLAIAMFSKAIKEEQSIKAAEKMLIILSKQADYKNKKMDPILEKRLLKKYGLSKEQYISLVKQAIHFLIKKNKCSGYYWLKEFGNGFVYDNDKYVFKNIKDASSICEKDNDNFYKMLMK